MRMTSGSPSADPHAQALAEPVEALDPGPRGLVARGGGAHRGPELLQELPVQVLRASQVDVERQDEDGLEVALQAGESPLIARVLGDPRDAPLQRRSYDVFERVSIEHDAAARRFVGDLADALGV